MNRPILAVVSFLALFAASGASATCNVVSNRIVILPGADDWAVQFWVNGKSGWTTLTPKVAYVRNPPANSPAGLTAEFRLKFEGRWTQQAEKDLQSAWISALGARTKPFSVCSPENGDRNIDIETTVKLTTTNTAGFSDPGNVSDPIVIITDHDTGQPL